MTKTITIIDHRGRERQIAVHHAEQAPALIVALAQAAETIAATKAA